jgi:phosphatidylglycerol:prolipoprotein diacylglycerol transferase
MLTIAFPNIDPIAFSIGPVDIRWYGLSYVVGILLAWAYARHLVKRYSDKVTLKDTDDYIVWATIGVVVGGRLGEALFYMPAEKFERWWEIAYIWTPGMSFHGGLIGVILITIIFCLRRKIPMLALGDIVACATPIGLFFGRLANFVNAELYGRVTDVSWAMVFPGGGPYARHPSQLYEAFLEGFVLFFGMMAVEYFTNRRRNNPGFMISLFLLGYGLARIIVENYREPDEYSGVFAFGITIGQILSAPVLMAGLAFLIYSLTHKKTSNDVGMVR